jgi:hypothetical protein
MKYALPSLRSARQGYWLSAVLNAELDTPQFQIVGQQRDVLDRMRRCHAATNQRVETSIDPAAGDSGIDGDDDRGRRIGLLRRLRQRRVFLGRNANRLHFAGDGCRFVDLRDRKRRRAIRRRT